MKHYKSERLKKLESEFNDLEQWLKLGLVPKRDIKKHQDEIATIRSKIDEEKERLQFLKESGDSEEYITPKRGQTRGSYTEMPTIPDVDSPDTQVGKDDSMYGDTEGGSSDSIVEEKEDATVTDEDDITYFNPNRWRKGIIDPDADEW